MWSKILTTALLVFALGSVVGAARDPLGLRGRRPAVLAAKKEAKREALGGSRWRNVENGGKPCIRGEASRKEVLQQQNLRYVAPPLLTTKSL